MEWSWTHPCVNEMMVAWQRVKKQLKRIPSSSEESDPRPTLGPVHTKTIVNANDSKRKLFYAFRPSVDTKTMKTPTVDA